MAYIINTGCLTRYFSFQPTPYLDSYFVQRVFNGSYHFSELTPLVLAILSLTVYRPQRCRITTYLKLSNFYYLNVRLKDSLMTRIMLTCGIILVYVNSFIALMNTRYYAQPNADAMHSSEYHVRHDVYRPKLHIGASQDEDLKASQKSMYNHPDEVSHIARPGQAVVVSGCATVDEIGLMVYFSCSGRMR